MPSPGWVQRLGSVLARTGLRVVVCALPLPAAASQGTPPEQVARAIAERRAGVQEFQLIKEASEELGLRAWLFGGTAAAFANYVRSDLAREGGDQRYQAEFFDYDFTSIYRSTQDADLVVDATPEQAERLEALIKERMGFLQGSKEYWEVRLLRHPRTAPGGQVKLPLLDNPDFLEQHTDSNSTGMIELTDPPGGESVVRDLRDWGNPRPLFLTDVAAGRLHYYWSPTHERTSRFLSGDNPPLFSVIRYLVKAFQYHLSVEGPDLERVKAVIEAFDPARDYRSLSPWAQGWLERYGPNLGRHAVDVEHAWDELEELGLREKLISLSDPSREGSLGWWLSREPLRTGPLGEGEGRTAAELGLEVVAHETRDYLAYESITHDPTLKPNVLISRPDQPGEAAASGAGFYTRIGRAGARGTGLTVRFAVDPRAREGSDFEVHGEVVLFKNRAALRVIPESVNVTMPEFFQLLAEGSLDHHDRGITMRLKRRWQGRPLSSQDQAELVGIVRDTLRRAGLGEPVGAPGVLAEWLALPVSQAHPELLDQLRQAVSGAVERGDLGAVTRLSAWFNLPASLDHPELVERMIERGGFDELLAKKILSRPGWSDYPELVQKLLRKGTEDQAMAQRVLVQGGWERHPELLRSLIEKAARPGLGLSERQSVLAWAATPLGRPHWKGHPELLAQLFDLLPDDPANVQVLVHWLMTQSEWKHHRELLVQSIERRSELLPAAALTLSIDKQWVDRPDLVSALIRRAGEDPAEVGLLASQAALALKGPHWASHPELILELVAQLDRIREQGRGWWWPSGRGDILLMPHWKDHPALRRLCGGEAPTVECLLGVVRAQDGRTDAERVGSLLRLVEAGSTAGECR